MKLRHTEVGLPANGQWLDGILAHHPEVPGLVVLAERSGSALATSRSAFLSKAIEDAGFATLHVGLLSHEEERRAPDTWHQVPVLTQRLAAVLEWIGHQPALQSLAIGITARDAAAAAMVLLDVTPLSLSIETVGGVASRLIERNSTIPTRHSQIFTTAAPFQTAVDINVFQGERRFVRDNKKLGSFRLDGIRRAPAGVPQIEVTFDIDANGIVQVSAKDLGTGRQQQITITSSSNMSEAEIERARRDAMQYESEDARQQELIDIRNQAESYTYAVEKEYEARKASLDKNSAKTLKADLDQLRKLVAKANPDRITEREAGDIREARYRLEQSVSSILNMQI